MIDFFFFIFSKTFLFTAFLSMNMEIVYKGNETETHVNKCFAVIITKHTLRILLPFTV